MEDCFYLFHTGHNDVIELDSVTRLPEESLGFRRLFFIEQNKYAKGVTI